MRSPTSRWTTFVAALTLATALAGCGNEGDGDESAGEGSGTGTAEEAATVECTYNESGDAAAEVEPPSGEAPEEGVASVSITTSAADLVLELDREATPCTVNSFVSLAEQGYFDGTECHRLVVQGIFVLQCGDPTATGTGGPGYQFDDELSGDETYGPGTLAMANAGPNTNGSQFFMVFEESPLPPDYTVFGTFDEASIEVLDEIATQGTTTGAPDGPPKEPVTLESVTVSEG